MQADICAGSRAHISACMRMRFRNCSFNATLNTYRTSEMWKLKTNINIFMSRQTSQFTITKIRWKLNDMKINGWVHKKWKSPWSSMHVMLNSGSLSSYSEKRDSQHDPAEDAHDACWWAGQSRWTAVPTERTWPVYRGTCEQAPCNVDKLAHTSATMTAWAGCHPRHTAGSGQTLSCLQPAYFFLVVGSPGRCRQCQRVLA